MTAAKTEDGWGHSAGSWPCCWARAPHMCPVTSNPGDNNVRVKGLGPCEERSVSGVITGLCGPGSCHATHRQEPPNRRGTEAPATQRSRPSGPQQRADGQRPVRPKSEGREGPAGRGGDPPARRRRRRGSARSPAPGPLHFASARPHTLLGPRSRGRSANLLHATPRGWA